MFARRGLSISWCTIVFSTLSTLYYSSCCLSHAYGDISMKLIAWQWALSNIRSILLTQRIRSFLWILDCESLFCWDQFIIVYVSISRSLDSISPSMISSILLDFSTCKYMLSIFYDCCITVLGLKIKFFNSKCPY